MGTANEFARTEPHGRGEAVCCACAHRWEAVAPVGTFQHECPACHCLKGHWVYEFAPQADRMQCNCGNQLFYITAGGHLCPNCGTETRYT